MKRVGEGELSSWDSVVLLQISAVNAERENLLVSREKALVDNLRTVAPRERAFWGWRGDSP